MRRRRVPVFRLGSRGLGDDQSSLRLCLQAFAKRPQASAGVAHTWQSRNGGPGRTAVTFGLASGPRVTKVLTVTLDVALVLASQKCQQSQESGVSWS